MLVILSSLFFYRINVQPTVAATSFARCCGLHEIHRQDCSRSYVPLLPPAGNTEEFRGRVEVLQSVVEVRNMPSNHLELRLTAPGVFQLDHRASLETNMMSGFTGQAS